MIDKLLFFFILVGSCLFNGYAQSGAINMDKSGSQFARPVILEGKVLIDQGVAPSGSIPVYLFCNNTVFRQTYTAGNGNFNFELGTRRSLFEGSGMDASTSSPQRLGFPSAMKGSQEEEFGPKIGTSATRSVNLNGCKIYAVLSGFQSDVINLGYRSVMDNPDLGVIVLHRLGGVRGTTVSVNTLTAPKRSKKAYEDAEIAMEEETPDFLKISEDLQKAVKSYSKFAAAWSLLGEVRLELEDLVGAQKAFERAIVEDPNYVTPYLLLAKLEIAKEQWSKVLEFSGKVLGLNPYIPLAHYFNAVAGYSSQDFELAEKSLAYLEESGEVINFPVAHYMLGSILAQKKDFPSAALEYQHFLEVNTNSQWADDLKSELAQWQEQGLIDSSKSDQVDTIVP